MRKQRYNSTPHSPRPTRAWERWELANITRRLRRGQRWLRSHPGETAPRHIQECVDMAASLE